MKNLQEANQQHTILLPQNMNRIVDKTIFTKNKIKFSASVIFLNLTCALASKLRIWMGPDLFFEGSPPIPRDTSGVAWSGGKMYVFGGFGYDGTVSCTLAQSYRTIKWSCEVSLTIWQNIRYRKELITRRGGSVDSIGHMTEAYCDM